MSVPYLNGEDLILRGVIELPRWGTWHAQLEVNAFDLPAGEVTISDGALSLVGTVRNAAKEGGRVLLSVVGGANGLTSQVDAKQYVGATMGLVLEDLALAVGERLDPGISDAVRYHTLPHWTRARGSAGQALSAITDALGPDYCWRFRADGTLWVGKDSWEVIELDDMTLLSQGPNTGSREYGSTADQALALAPGLTFDGLRIAGVVHHIDAKQTRTVIYSAESRERLKGAAESAINALVGRKLDYLALYPCRVARQSGQKVDLIPDDERIRGAGFQSVDLWHGLPGAQVTIAVGARVLLGFHAGDPSRPYAALWNTDASSVTEIKLGDGAAQVVRLGDTIHGVIDTGSGTVKIESLTREDLLPETKVYN